ncbi:MAG: chromosomal replication initiator protein DnaA [Fimbriimonadaceae bacterium]|nr:chromosomal replication initiator protein DnaA [Fimbriimonadaceae bacterium]
MDQYNLDDSDLQIRLRGAWEQVLRRLSAEISPAWFERFIKPLKAAGFEEGVVVLAAPGRFVHEWVRERYLDKLTEMLSDELGEQIAVNLLSEAREKSALLGKADDSSVKLSVGADPSFRPAEKFCFETFVVGQSNRLAFAGAKSVADEPGAKYNPLFIYGPSGLGKTHLLHAIARTILAKDPRYPLVYISAQQFAEQFVHALQTNRIEQFRRMQRNVGIWLVDDIQFVAGKDKTQEEVFHTFNYLHSLGKQIVLTSDRPPRDLTLMDERLRSRFESGLVADIAMPDTETRCAILLSKAEQERVTVEPEVAMFLAESVPGNIRTLEGALTKLAALASIENLQIDRSLAEKLIEAHYRERPNSKPGFTEIVDSVSRHFKIPVEDICGISRKAPIVHARHIAVFLTRELTRDSWKHIGTLFGDRDHTSMMHGYQKISDMITRDKELRVQVKSLMRSLYPDH